MPAPRRRHRHTAACLALAFLLGLASLPASAVPAPSAANVAAAQQQAADAQARLAKMQSAFSQNMSSYNQAASDLAKTRTQIAANSRRLSVIEAQLKSGEAELSARADFLYRTGGEGFIDVVFGSNSFEQFSSRLYLVSRIASQEAQLIATLKQDHAEASRLRTELAARESQQAALVGKVRAQRDAVQGAMSQQQAYIDSLSSDVAALVAAQQRAAAQATPVDSGPVGNLTASSSTASSKPHSKGVGYAQATVQGRSGTYTVMADAPKSYQPTNISFSGGCSVFSTADGSSSTASGRRLVDSDLVCAHKSLPFGTRVAITRGSRKVIVVVIDRGPYVRGRVLDVTPAVARILGIDGVGNVKAEVVRPL